MAIKYNIKAKTSVLPVVEMVVLFWQKGRLELTGKDKAYLEKMFARLQARGDAGEHQSVPFPVGGKSRVIFACGLGEKPTADLFRRGVAAAAQHARQAAIRDITIVVPSFFTDGFEVGLATAEAVELGTYLFAKYQIEAAKTEKERNLQSVELHVGRGLAAAVTRGFRVGKVFSEATILARNLVNEPSVNMRPADLAEIARELARNSTGQIFTEVLDRKECEARGMGAFLAVAQGSSHEPYFVHLVYQPQTNTASNALPKVALVGKGITFDSGGLSIKPADSMETMKCDMAGAAAVLGIFSVLEKIKPAVVLHGYFAACENMPSGAAIKPGDVITTASGKTVEIRNTDAEGRLTLADSITEALKVKPDFLIDLATLTGACVVALGEEVSGLFANNQELADNLSLAAQKEGEQIWPMPLVDDYRQAIKSSIADLRNVSLKRWGGAITAALFLEAFVEKTPWSHLDIAGPAYAEQQVNPVNPVGASGFATRTVLRYLMNLKPKKK